MKERPILFSAPMVRALLDGSKTQTRRVVKLPHTNPLGKWEVLPWGGPNGGRTREGHTVPFQNVIGHSRTGEIIGCPHGQPGDRLWVRENGWERPSLSPRDLREGADTWPPYEYDAEPLMCWEDGELKRYGWKRRPSIHMPRWACRIDLQITAVRVERLQDISEADAIAEGCSPAHPDDEDARHHYTPRWAYEVLWEQINGAGSWAANPWVWVVEFRRIKP